MSELSTAARPYAKAVFELARDNNQLPEWSEKLAFLAIVARDPTMRALLDSPTLTTEQAAQLIVDIAGDTLDTAGQNLIRLLAENKRLVVLPQIADQFEQYKREAEGKIETEVVSAAPLSEAQKNEIAQALGTRLGREISLVCTIDEELIGGAVVRAGDLVIDGSIRGRLASLANALSR